MMQVVHNHFQVLVDGKHVRTYQHGGKEFFCAKPGDKFQILVGNEPGTRTLALISVDGLNVLTGKKASSEDSRGYVVDGDGGTIKGWRTSDDKVSEFVFSSKGDSYSAKGGEGTSTGVIACAFYSEKDTPRMVYTSANVAGAAYDSGAHFTAQSASLGASSLRSGILRGVSNYRQSSVGSLGTAFGDEVDSRVESVSFVRGSKIWEQAAYYDTYENLKAMGVPVDEPPTNLPSGFPKDDDKFCKPPKK